MVRSLTAFTVSSVLLLAPSLSQHDETAEASRLLSSAAQAGLDHAGRAGRPGHTLTSAALPGAAPANGDRAVDLRLDVDVGFGTSVNLEPDVDVTSPPAIASFGFGAQTSFFPSDSPRELVLSFDDGPDLKFTPIVLDELDRRGVKAIFFVTGHRLVGDRPEDFARRELVRKIAAHGHLVANHTMSHRNLCRFPDDLAAEIDGNGEMIAAATGVRPLLFRAPYGARCPRLEAALAERQLVSVGWNLDPQDWKSNSAAEVLGYLQARLARLEGRGILLLHDTHPASVFALGPLLDWIARENRRAERDDRPPIRLRDYAVFLPKRPLPVTGLGTLVTSLLGRLPPAAAAGSPWIDSGHGVN